MTNRIVWPTFTASGFVPGLVDTDPIQPARQVVGITLNRENEYTKDFMKCPSFDMSTLLGGQFYYNYSALPDKLNKATGLNFKTVGSYASYSGGYAVLCDENNKTVFTTIVYETYSSTMAIAWIHGNKSRDVSSSLSTYGSFNRTDNILYDTGLVGTYEQNMMVIIHDLINTKTVYIALISGKKYECSVEWE